MSQLEDLLKGSRYARLTAYPAQKISTGADRNFSVRLQSDTDNTKKATTAADFFSNTQQTGFDIGDSSNALSVNGFQKASGVSKTHFTGTIGVNPTIGDTAIAPTTGLSAYYFSIKKSNRVGNMQYFATDASTRYLAINSTTPGAVLTYNV